jgi:hypothetical protein
MVTRYEMESKAAKADGPSPCRKIGRKKLTKQRKKSVNLGGTIACVIWPLKCKVADPVTLAILKTKL